MNPLLAMLLYSHLYGNPHLGGMFGGGLSPLLSHLFQGMFSSPAPRPAPSPSPGAPGNGPVRRSPPMPGPGTSIPPRFTMPGTPTLQGFRGDMSALRNPNQGGFNGLGGSEMATPGLGAGLYGRRSTLGAI